ncbi:MAG: penicillin-binding transpeptidase domain-containing protein [Actinomycetota bacterium]|nr:penicillin-binding transpeptidase domain-containing protein [Actinomycetota bacterium]
MSRRLSMLASFILLLFVVVAGQSAYVQYFHASALAQSAENPRNNTVSSSQPRGQILAADGTILADSLPVGTSGTVFQREYPLGSLTAGVVGFVAPALAGATWGLEEQYNSELTAHTQPAQNFEQVLAPTTSADNVQTTIYPALQKIAQVAMGGQDGAAVVIQPQTGAIMGMYSNPTYEPEYLASPSYSTALSYYNKYAKNNANGFPPLGLVATQQIFPPGSTFKVVTTAAATVYQPSLLTKVYPSNTNFYLPPQTNHKIFNSGFSNCGGTVQQMLPVSCDPGYAHLGVDLGAVALSKEANAFGYNSSPPIDLPSGRPIVSNAYFPSAASLKYNVPFVAYSAIGQGNVRSTTLEQALVAAGIADGGTIMTPHLMAAIIGPDGSLIRKYADSVWKKPLTKAQASIIVPLMRNVVVNGTASGIFLPQDQVAAKTGTAQERNLTQTDDWMIAFAPASHPTVAVAVMMPYQPKSNFGATVAGPIIKCLIEGALAIQAGQPATGTSSTCPS